MRHIGIPEFTILSLTFVSLSPPPSPSLSLLPPLSPSLSSSSPLLRFFVSSFTVETTCTVSLPAACFGTGATPKMSSYVIEYRLCVESPPLCLGTHSQPRTQHRDEDDKDREKREIGSRTSRELASHSRQFERFSGILTVKSGRTFSDRLDQLSFFLDSPLCSHGLISRNCKTFIYTIIELSNDGERTLQREVEGGIRI